MYILSMVKDRVRVVCWYSFFVRATAPPMDRGWRGSRPRSPRYHTAIGRARPDPKRDPGCPHLHPLTHRSPHPRDPHFTGGLSSRGVRWPMDFIPPAIHFIFTPHGSGECGYIHYELEQRTSARGTSTASQVQYV